MNAMRIIFIYLWMLLFFSLTVSAQDDLLNELNKDLNTPKKKELVAYSFKSTRLVNAHTLECLGRRALDFRIAHRFGTFNSKAYNLWGLDGPATLKLSLEYSFTGRWMVGVGRSNVNKMYDGFLKHRLLRQTVDNSMPLSVTLLQTLAVVAQKDLAADITGVNKYASFANRMAFASQIIIGRKFNKRVTIQVSPTYIHWNLVDKTTQKNDMYSLIGGGRFKFTKSMAINLEYGMRLNNNSSDYTQYFNSFSVGWDIETGGHVFQMFVTNSTAMNEVQFIPYTNASWKNGGIRLGFNVSRVFAL
jgi:hypothetical protein